MIGLCPKHQLPYVHLIQNSRRLRSEARPTPGRAAHQSPCLPHLLEARVERGETFHGDDAERESPALAAVSRLPRTEARSSFVSSYGA